MLTKYLIQNRHMKRDIVIGYNENGKLAFYDADCELSNEQAEWFVANIPFAESDVPTLHKKTNGKLTVTKAITDLSFDNAYNTYNHKVGKKEKARKLWDKMADADRLKFFRTVPKYKAYLNRTGEGMAYLETFLYNAYYNNEYQ